MRLPLSAFPSILALMVFATLPAIPARAQSRVVTATPSVVVGGSHAATQGDVAAGNGGPAAIVGGSHNVMICGRPGAHGGDPTDIGGLAVGGSTNVFINGKPMATAGSAVTNCLGQ